MKIKTNKKLILNLLEIKNLILISIIIFGLIEIMSANTPPTHSFPILNSTYGTNATNENLTCYPQNVSDLEVDNVSNIFNWYLNNNSIAVLNMPFDKNSSTNAKDYSSYENNGTINGAAWISEGKVGGAYKFDRIDDHITLNSDSLKIIGNITIEAWIKSDVMNGSWSAVVNQGDGELNYGLWLYQNKVAWYADDMSPKRVDGSTILSPKTWYHVASVYDKSANKVYIYLNGGVDNAKTNVNGSINYTSNAFKISYPSNNPFNGAIDEVRIYNRALSPEEIKAHYNLKYNKIVSQETNEGEKWMCEVTLNDCQSDGDTLSSNELLISVMESDCNDSLDNDGDGFVGCEDTDCSKYYACAPSNQTNLTILQAMDLDKCLCLECAEIVQNNYNAWLCDGCLCPYFIDQMNEWAFVAADTCMVKTIKWRGYGLVLCIDNKCASFNQVFGNYTAS